MKKAICLFCLILLAIGIGGCTKKTEITDQTTDSKVDQATETKQTKKILLLLAVANLFV